VTHKVPDYPHISTVWESCKESGNRPERLEANRNLINFAELRKWDWE